MDRNRVSRFDLDLLAKYIKRMNAILDRVCAPRALEAIDPKQFRGACQGALRIINPWSRLRPCFTPIGLIFQANIACANRAPHLSWIKLDGEMRAACRASLARSLVEETLEADSSDARLGALMSAAQAGDRAAYAELLRLAIPVITRIVAPRCNRGLETDDVVQDVLTALHAVRHTYDCNRPFTPWLASIARHRLVDAYRRKARVSQNEAPVPELPETFSAAESNWEMSGKGDPELLRRAIADLPAGQRQAVELLKLQQLSLKEASQASGMSIAALKVAVHRGVKTLRERLTREEPDRAGK